MTPEFQDIDNTGEGLKRDILNHLSAWPIQDANGNLPSGDMLPENFRSEAEGLQDRASRWFNLLALKVLSHTTYERTHANILLRRISAAIRGRRYYEEYRPRQFVYGLSRVAHGTVSQVERNVECIASLQDATKETTKGSISRIWYYGSSRG
jgi:hypothetical protein